MGQYYATDGWNGVGGQWGLGATPTLQWWVGLKPGKVETSNLDAFKAVGTGLTQGDRDAVARAEADLKAGRYVAKVIQPAASITIAKNEALKNFRVKYGTTPSQTVPTIQPSQPAQPLQPFVPQPTPPAPIPSELAPPASGSSNKMMIIFAVAAAVAFFVLPKLLRKGA